MATAIGLWRAGRALPNGLYGFESSDPTKKTIASLAFSEENKHLVLIITDKYPELKGSIESKAVFYEWHSKWKVNAISAMNYVVHKIYFNPMD